jgi:thioredoxin-related protein
MKITRLFGAAVALSLLLILTTAQAVEKIVWAKSLDAAMTEAKKSNKLVMVDFYTDWCKWCKVLDKKTYSDARVVKAATQVIAVKVNAEAEGSEAAQKYQVRAYPTIVFLAPDGSVAGQINGYTPPEAFVAEMNKFILIYKEFPLLEAKAANGNADATTWAKLTAIYANKNDRERTSTSLEKLEQSNLSEAKAYLAMAYNAAGDMYQLAEQFDKAIPLFQKAAQYSKTPYDKAYAHLSRAICLFSTGKLKQAIPDLKTLLAMPKPPAEMKELAQKMLAIANRPHR